MSDAKVPEPTSADDPPVGKKREELSFRERSAMQMAEQLKNVDVVVKGGDVSVTGTFAGSMRVEAGTVDVDGAIVGNLVNEGGTVNIRGKVTGLISGEHNVVESPGESSSDDDTGDDGGVLHAVPAVPEPEPEARPAVIEVEGLGKKFAVSLKGSMRHGVSDVMSAISVRKKRAGKGQDEFWALRDVNFSLYEGGAIGMMGLNGSGKTTLMRILAGLYEPDEGTVTVHGNALGIFGVGTGFHPHLSGRENVYINASLLGMTRTEIDDHIDEILDFAELGNFIDTATGLYSSGMRMRLGFAILSVIRPRALLLDEVFAVGDLAFREKCMDRLREMRSTTTIFIVAQHPAILSGICDDLLWIHQGKVREYGEYGDVMDRFTRFAGRAQIEGSRGSGRDATT